MLVLHDYPLELRGCNHPSQVVEREILTFKVKGSRPQKPSQLFHEILPLKLDWAFINGLQGHHKINMEFKFLLVIYFDFGCFSRTGVRYLLHFNAYAGLIPTLLSFISLHILGSHYTLDIKKKNVYIRASIYRYYHRD